MGHACNIMTFDSSMSKKDIQKKCDLWANRNCDLEERGWDLDRGLDPIRFTSKVFDDYESACEYLKGTFGHYDQTAVQYKVYPTAPMSKRYNELSERLVKAKARLWDLEGPHYKGVSIGTVKCKSCGSSLATAYCGKSWNNHCPICRSDVRPESKLEKIRKCKKSILEMESAIRDEEKKAQMKVASKAKLFWAVACEVHS